jgi:hypothetical protein
MAKEEPIEVEGKVVETLPNAMFRVELEMDTASWLIFPEKCACILSRYCRAIELLLSFLPTILLGEGLYTGRSKTKYIECICDVATCNQWTIVKEQIS